MDKNALLKRLVSAQHNDDTEMAHITADDAIIEFLKGIEPEIAAAYEKVNKWYS